MVSVDDFMNQTLIDEYADEEYSVDVNLIIDEYFEDNRLFESNFELIHISERAYALQ